METRCVFFEVGTKSLYIILLIFGFKGLILVVCFISLSFIIINRSLIMIYVCIRPRCSAGYLMTPDQLKGLVWCRMLGSVTG
jgi:hypothetical protein